MTAAVHTIPTKATVEARWQSYANMARSFLANPDPRLIASTEYAHKQFETAFRAWCERGDV